MADKNTYAPTLIDEIVSLFKANKHLEGYFNRFIYGHPDEIPQDELPSMSLKKLNNDIEGGATQTDNSEQTIEVIVYVNKKDDLGNPDDEVTGNRAMEQIIEGIDVSTGQFDSNTICGIIRKYLSINNQSVSQKMSIDYTPDVPRGQDYTTQEAKILFTIKRIIQVPVRS